MAVLITKAERDYHGIDLAEVVWKLGMVILNFCLTTSIDFHDVFHGFWAGRGIGSTSLEAKLIHQLMAMRLEGLYEIFMDLYKSYEALYMGRCLEIF